MTKFEHELLKARNKLRRFARLLTKTREDAEDLIQDALLSAWESKERFQINLPIAPWLNQIIRRGNIDRLRAADTEKRALSHYVTLQKLGVLTPEDLNEECEEVYAAYLTLSAHEQRLIFEVGLMGRQYQEVAEELDMPINTVKTNVKRGRDRIREMTNRKRAVRRSKK